MPVMVYYVVIQGYPQCIWDCPVEINAEMKAGIVNTTGMDGLKHRQRNFPKPKNRPNHSPHPIFFISPAPDQKIISFHKFSFISEKKLTIACPEFFPAGVDMAQPIPANTGKPRKIAGIKEKTHPGTALAI
ncbi:MAG: hypothetical protein V6Z89_07225 [Desulfobacter sp.]